MGIWTKMWPWLPEFVPVNFNMTNVYVDERLILIDTEFCCLRVFGVGSVKNGFTIVLDFDEMDLMPYIVEAKILHAT